MVKDNFTLFPEIDKKLNQPQYSLPNSKDEIAVAYWNKCLSIIKDNVDIQAYKTWFEPIKAHSWSPNKLTILVPSQWFYEWIETHYFTLLQKTIHRVIGEDATLLYEVVVEEKKETLESRTIRVPGLKYPTNNAIASSNGSQEVRKIPNYLNPRYVFDNFIIGDSNQLAYYAAMAVAGNPGKTRYNPFFIYGTTGLGKTHLAQAIGNHIITHNSKAKVLYTNSELFTIEFINAIKSNKANEFVNLYRDLDVLIVDDIQFLGGKEKTQDSFFHTFNALYQAGKQLIFTSDKPPKDIVGLDDRLISRLQWGLIADIQPPDYETRVAIISRKSEDEGIQLPDGIIELLARHITTSIREIEGALINLLAKVTFDRKPLTLEVAQEVVFGASVINSGLIDLTVIKRIVSEHFNIDVPLMESKSRKHEVALPRQMAMFLAKQLTITSLKSIGAAFGGRDHSTVLHSCQTIENYLVTDKTIKNSYNTLISKLKK